MYIACLVCENGFQDMNCADSELSQNGMVGKGKRFVQVCLRRKKVVVTLAIAWQCSVVI
jgi:hypothetical protein